MKAAAEPLQRPSGAKLLAVDATGAMRHMPRSRLPDLLAPGDLLVANDAATWPASLPALHTRTGEAIEVRLAGSRSVSEVREFTALLFGAGDHRTPTEHRPLPPAVRPGDALAVGTLRAQVRGTDGHPRLVRLRFEGGGDAIRAALARHGRPVQYAHMPRPLALWDVWTRVAARPAALEPPSAGFLLDWSLLAALREQGVGFATLTHAAGLSSTGDAALDARLPLDEPYEIPAVTVAAIARAHAAGGRVVALGTTVVRALEHAMQAGDLRPGPGLADLKIGASTRLRVVDAIVSGTHEPGTSHYELLRAFAADGVLRRASAELEAGGYLTHEFGDSVWLERAPCRPRPAGSGRASRRIAGPTAETPCLPTSPSPPA